MLFNLIIKALRVYKNYAGQLRNKINYHINFDKPDSTVIIGQNFRFKYDTSIIEIGENSKISFGDAVIFRDFCNLFIFTNAQIILGNKVFFNRYCSINCLGKISIGDYTIFGEGVKLYDHNHIYNDVNTIIQENDCKRGEITIGRNCWIGANVTILNNVTIGDNVIIGANNLIYKSIPSNVIVKHKEDHIIASR